MKNILVIFAAAFALMVVACAVATASVRFAPPTGMSITNPALTLLDHANKEVKGPNKDHNGAEKKGSEGSDADPNKNSGGGDKPGISGDQPCEGQQQDQCHKITKSDHELH